MELQAYYVIWRGDEDDFMITQLDLPPQMMAWGDDALDNNQIIQMCWDAEFGHDPSYGTNPYVGEDCASYDLIEIVTGTDVQFIARL